MSGIKRHENLADKEKAKKKKKKIATYPAYHKDIY